jgi:hypothetical protein
MCDSTAPRHIEITPNYREPQQVDPKDNPMQKERHQSLRHQTHDFESHDLEQEMCELAEDILPAIGTR